MAQPSEKQVPNPYRVMVVDDSVVVRGMITRMLESDPTISVISSVGNGDLAVKAAMRKDIEVVVLDIEMPVMDGLTALPKLLAHDSTIKVIMASTLTMRNAEISMRALSLGAADYVPKPTSSRGMSGATDFREEITRKVQNLGRVRRQERGEASPSRTAERVARAKPAVARLYAEAGPIKLRKRGVGRPDLIAIGSSTGGPQALFTLLKGLRGKTDLPIIITQHMPATFTTILAEHITRMSGWPCDEAKDGMPIRRGHILLAPGGFHMVVVQKGPERVVSLNQDPPVNFCRPAVDPMFQSASSVYGARVLAIVLTGMGQDGLGGAKIVVDGGGTLIAQDKETSVVWGMPGAVATAGICSAVLPIDDLADEAAKIARGIL